MFLFLHDFDPYTYKVKLRDPSRCGLLVGGGPKENNFHVACYWQDTHDPGREGGRKKLLTNTRKEESHDDASPMPMDYPRLQKSNVQYSLG